MTNTLPDEPAIMQAKVTILQRRVAKLESQLQALQGQLDDLHFAYHENVPDLTTQAGIQRAIDQAGITFTTLCQLYLMSPEPDQKDN